MFKDQKLYLRQYHMVSDMVCIAILYFVLTPFFIFFEFNTSLYFKLSPIIISIPLILSNFQHYKKIELQKYGVIYFQTFIISSIFSGILFFILSILNPYLFLNILYSTGSALFLWIILIVNRLHIAHKIKHGSSNQNFIKHILIIGTGENAASLSKYIIDNPETGLRIVGFLSEKRDETKNIINGKPVLGTIQDAAKVINDHYTDCVLYSGEHGYELHYNFLFTTCLTRSIDFATLQSIPEINKSNHIQIFQENIDNFSVKILKSVYFNPQYIFWKRVFDFTVAIILLGITLPLWIVIAILIKITSPGPIFFSQERIGKYGKKFKLYKFRSMVKNAEKLQEGLEHLNEMDGPAFKIHNDPRQTITGRFLRKTSLDELPQILNVLKGDISLVGPRPAIEKEVLQYHPWERKRLSVVQGITCIWQISGRNTIKFDEWMKLDVMYIENRTMALDFKILLKTIPAVLLKKGAY